MDKQVQFYGKTDLGIFCQGLFEGGAFEKTAGAPPFADWATGEHLRKFISKITKEERKKYSYALVNALGAGEFFGSNINADYFPWNALAHEGTDYGYKTFEHFAHAYQHHKNKDPSRAFGVPVLSVLNLPMKRVELIVRLDRSKAKEEQADGIISRIDKGEFPDVSMGCKVPYDVCSICQQKSKTRFDYCQHMSPPEELRGVYGPNKILPDGRRIYVINTLPKFFDISFVFIGADKTAKVMAKVASKGEQVCLGDVCTIPRPSAEIAEKVAFRNDDIVSGGKADNKPASAFNPKSLKAGTKVEKEHTKSKALAREIASDHLEEDPKYYDKLKLIHKEASVKTCACGCGTCDPTEKLAEVMGVKHKLGEMLKRIPSTGSFVNSVLPKLEQSEEDIPNEVLDELSESGSIRGIASAASCLGIVLKPHEFQRIVLVKMGEQELANRLDDNSNVFRSVPDSSHLMVLDPASAERTSIERLRDFVPTRSGLGKNINHRLLKVSGIKNSLPTRTPIEHPLLDKISAAYNGYRQSLIQKLAQVENVIQSDPTLREVIMGLGLSDVFSKTANADILSSDAVTYMMGAYITDKNLQIESATVDAVAELMA